jgi:hypothetical protein
MVPDCVPADPAKIRQRPQVRIRQAPALAWRWPATAAAALLLGMAGGLSLGHGGTGQRQAAPAASFSGVNPAAGISATAALQATSWGTSIGLRLDGVPRATWSAGWSSIRGGGAEITGAWSAWSAWSPGTVSVPASAAWRPADITSLQVTVGKRTLVTLTAVRSGANAGTLPPGGG